MDDRMLSEVLQVADKMTMTVEPPTVGGGRSESTAAQSWKLAMMAYFMKDEFPEVDRDKVVRMCVFHDLYKAFFNQDPGLWENGEEGEKHAARDRLGRWLETLPPSVCRELEALFYEMDEEQTLEAKIYSALKHALV